MVAAGEKGRTMGPFRYPKGSIVLVRQNAEGEPEVSVVVPPDEKLPDDVDAEARAEA